MSYRTTLLSFTLLCTALAATLPGQTAAPPESVTPPPAAIAAPAPLPPPIERAEAPVARMPEASAMTREYGMSWREAWHYGGVIMWIILAISILAGALTLYLLFILRPAQIAPHALVAELRDRLNEGDHKAARRACESRNCSLASIGLVALDYLRNTPDANTPLLKDIIIAEGNRQAEDLQSQTQFLLDISVIAPMLGLLGTVLGMLKAFGSIAQDFTAAKPVILAQGVSQAIITTIFGLAVAIPCMLLYSWFRRRTVRMVALLETAAVDLLTALSGSRTP